ncbi:putative mannose 6-phosphate receptor-like protein [Cyphellophora attinorum]|uniref:Putative mannose 6-phosphate receptor-like protein n=1 Tax=Cyphellophora attinorum TaxID=1664694 RepID=A0A0N1NWF4_9EURO|nr:putative mannose 6-phosphate receptor-like protein [Phialophora attinorum]KPI35202.1 putative mannose 6-phosphate receptor-like protein [Phialophora attinorum]
MHLLPSLIALLSLTQYTTAASDDKKPAPKPCTIHSPTTGSFIDMRPLALSRDGAGSSSQSSTNESYHAKGYDYPYNFTLNFCDSVVEKLEDVNGVKERNWRNVSAFYKDSHDNIISIGQQNSELLPGRPNHKKRAILDDDDDDDRHKGKKTTRRKTTMMTFACDTSPLLAGKPAISFLGTPDHCTYLFEVRSRHACGGTTTQHESGTLGPGGVFLVITGIALLVYLIGGIVYQRNVMHQRGWRQLPHYGMWAGIFSFVSDMTQILFGSCINRIPSVQRLFGGRGRGGYHRVGTEDNYNDRTNGASRSAGTGGRNGGRDADAENRLIDSYDEEWEN